MAERYAEVLWEGGLATGRGTVTSGSGVLQDEEVSWPRRVESAEGKTSPEELIAAAHASCFAMALSLGLAKAGTPPEQLDTSAAVTFVPGEGITRAALTVVGRVPGIDAAAFQEAAEAAKDGCPVSGALKGNVELTLDARLQN